MLVAGVLGFATTALAAGVGQNYGTRDPVTCPSRTMPLNAQTAAKYFTCDAEHESGDEM